MPNSYPPINALLRGLEILSHISALGAASVRDLHARTGISKPTIVRNLETLEHAGYISKSAENGAYSLTARTLSLSSGYQHHNRIVELAVPILNEFRESMPWPSDLALFDGEAMVILETNRNPGTLALNRQAGTRLSVTQSALGRAFLAFCEPQLRSAVLDKAFAGPSGEERALYERELTRFQELGYSENDQSLSEQTRGVGVPIIVEGRVESCINTIVLAEAMSMQDVIARCVPPLKQVAEKIAEALKSDKGHIE